MRKLIFKTLILILIFSFISCTKEEANQQTINTTKYISLSESIKKLQEIKSHDSKSTIIDTIQCFTVNDCNNVPAIHFISYTDQNRIDTNFSIMFADDNLYPEIAFGNGIFEEELIDEGISNWLNIQLEVIESVRANNVSYTDYIDDYIGTMVEPQEPCEGISYLVVKGPLLTTKWEQGCIYNEDIQVSCYPIGECGKAPVGCGAVAVAQILNYYEYPDDFNYNLLKDEYFITDLQAEKAEIARLMYDVGQKLDMNYYCYGSYINTPEITIIDGFFDYDYNTCNSVEYDYNSNLIMNDIDNLRPVILFGGNEELGTGHIWNCDGYRKHRICDIDEMGNIFSFTYLLLHMNWGLKNQAGNGWFAFNNWWGIEDHLGFIYNINP